MSVVIYMDPGNLQRPKSLDLLELRIPGRFELPSTGAGNQSGPVQRAVRALHCWPIPHPSGPWLCFSEIMSHVAGGLALILGIYFQVLGLQACSTTPGLNPRALCMLGKHRYQVSHAPCLVSCSFEMFCCPWNSGLYLMWLIMPNKHILSLQ